MQYDKEILRVLAEAGSEGLSVQKISRHVFNACNSLFNSLNQEDVHKYVQMYLVTLLLKRVGKEFIDLMRVINCLNNSFFSFMTR